MTRPLYHSPVRSRALLGGALALAVAIAGLTGITAIASSTIGYMLQPMSHQAEGR